MQRIIIFALTTLAAALGLENADPTTWFGETAVLAVVVGATIAGIRKAINLDGIAVVIASVAVGGGFGGIGYAAGLFAQTATLVEAVGFGLAAGWLASGAVDLARAALSRAGGSGN